MSSVLKQKLESANNNPKQQIVPSGLTESIASYAQQRIYMHESLYFHNSDVSIYNMLFPLEIQYGSVRIECLHSSILLLLEQTPILRTSVRFNSRTNAIEQRIEPLTNEIYSFQHSYNISTLDQIDQILTKESMEKHFDVEKGRVFRYHLIQRKHTEFLEENDLIVFVFHHIAGDLSSIKLFMERFEQICWSNHLEKSILSSIQYIDIALYEQQLLGDQNPNSPMNQARRFWSNLLNEYNWNQTLQMGSFRNKQLRSGHGYSSKLILDQNIVDQIMFCSSTNSITMFSLILACYYIFLFQLNPNQNDFCIAIDVANRFDQQMDQIMGMFVNTLPYRIKIKPKQSFDDIVQQVHQLNNDILQYSSLPYQEIIKSQTKNQSHMLPSIGFHFESLLSSITSKNATEIAIGEDCIASTYLDKDRIHDTQISLYDINLTIIHDHHKKYLECFFNCSADIASNQATHSVPIICKYK
ncbi:hypothetical protein I4U23_031555 [Adineta vaga]|nr:hypothetical protein I4U23_031555 [Adineta vaga]